MESARRLSFPSGPAPVRGVTRLSAERDLLPPELVGWDRTFLRRARRPFGALRGRSRDRLDALGERFFDETLRRALLPEGVRRAEAARAAGEILLLESAGCEHVVRPLARHLGADRMTARQLEFRDGRATGATLPAAEELPVSVRRRSAAPAILADGAEPAPLHVRRVLAGRRILLIGGTGFIGKIWLARVLGSVPELGRVHLLLRRRAGRSPEDRVERMLRESPVFADLRRDGLPHVHVHEGDIRCADFALPGDRLAELARRIDLVVSCAGITEFNPDPREALAVNVDGVHHLLNFVERCEKAALLHVSTCFVAGRREGRIPEEIDPYRTPAGEAGFDPREERERLSRVMDPPDTAPPPPARARALVLDRARELGWPNIYTFTKALGEGLLELAARESPRLRATVVRPSIVESALSFPFPGWNEGVNTSAPLSHLLGTQFRQLPVNRRKRLDVIPVDLVGAGLTLAAAALVEGKHDRVVHLATSSVNPLDLARAVELTALAHGRHYRSCPDWRSRVLARLGAVPVSQKRYGRLSVPAQLRAVRAMNRALRALGVRPPLARVERALARAKALVDLYEPFLLNNEPIFEADHIQKLAWRLPEGDLARFGYDAASVDWYEYWIHVHIPGLRRWSYPILEGRAGPIVPEPAPSRAAGPEPASAAARP